MKRSDFRITNEKVIQQLTILLDTSSITNEELERLSLTDRYQSNQRYLIFLELKELVQLVDKKGLTIQGLKKELQQHRGGRSQGKLFQ